MAQGQKHNQRRATRQQAARPGQGAKPRPEGRRARQRAEQAQAQQRRRLTMILGAVTALIIAAIVVAAILLNQAPSQSGALTNPNAFNPTSRPLKVGDTAPNFDLPTVNGTRYSLAAQRGHVVLLELFAVWCPHCQREAAILNQIEQHFGPSGLRAMAILASPYGRNYDISGQTDLSPATAADVTWFKNTFKVTHPLLIDHNYATVNTYGLVNNGYPTIYILDGHGVVRYAVSGDQPYQQLATAIGAASAHR